MTNSHGRNYITDLKRSTEIDRNLKVYITLSSYLRHITLNNLNIANLAVHMYKKDQEIDEGFLDMLEDSIDTASDYVMRTHELEELLIFYKGTLETYTLADLLDEAFKQFSSEMIELEVKGNSKIQVEGFYSTVIRGILRNALKYRNATKLEIRITQNDTKFVIEFIDNGELVPSIIKTSLEKGNMFDSRVHDQSYIDLFITNEILKNYGVSMQIIDESTIGCHFSLTTV